MTEEAMMDQWWSLVVATAFFAKDKPPSPQIRIEFFVGVALFLLSYLCGFFGGQRLHDQRNLIGASLVGCSFLFLGLSLFLFVFGGKLL